MIRAFRPEDLEPVQALLAAEGWGRRAQDPTRLRQIVEAATRALVVEVDGQVVGFGRCVTDAVSNGYLSMVVVDASHRRRGLGRELVDALTGSDPALTWVLRAGHPGSEPFWEALGFRRSAIAFERQRRF